MKKFIDCAQAVRLLSTTDDRDSHLRKSERRCMLTLYMRTKGLWLVAIVAIMLTSCTVNKDIYTVINSDNYTTLCKDYRGDKVLIRNTNQTKYEIGDTLSK